jgi:hypothetical protein
VRTPASYMSIRQPSKVAKYCKQNELHEGRGASRHETNAWTGRWTADGPARTGPSELRRLTRLESHVIDTVSYRVLVISGFWTGFLDGILQDSRSLSLQAATCILHAATACPPSSLGEDLASKQQPLLTPSSFRFPLP